MRRSTSRLYALAGARAARHDSGTLTSTIGPVLLENLRHGVQQGQEQGRGLSAKLVASLHLAAIQQHLHYSERSSSSQGDHPHPHHSHRAPWLRAFVLGANDGLVSTSSLLMGVGAASSDHHTIVLSGVAGLVGGALSMAVGEYISVSSQRDAEAADVEQERLEQLKGAEAQARELEELSQIYEGRGLPPHLARQVAEVLTEKDVVRAHARDELGIDVDQLARPVQAAVVSAITFSLGAGIPLLAACCVPDWKVRMAVVLASTTVGLAGFGSLAAWLGGAHKMQAAARVVLGGWAAMGLTFGIGTLFEAA